MDTMHLKDALVLFGSEGSGLTLHLFPLSLRIISKCYGLLCQCAFKHSLNSIWPIDGPGGPAVRVQIPPRAGERVVGDLGLSGGFCRVHR